MVLFVQPEYRGTSEQVTWTMETRRGSEFHTLLFSLLSPSLGMIASTPSHKEGFTWVLVDPN